MNDRKDQATSRWLNASTTTRFETTGKFGAAAVALAHAAKAVEDGQRESLPEVARLVHELERAAPRLGLDSLSPTIARIGREPRQAWDAAKELLYLFNNPHRRPAMLATGAPAATPPARQPAWAARR